MNTEYFMRPEHGARTTPRKKSHPPQVRLAAQKIQANRLKMGPTPLQLLRYAVHVPQPPLERLIVKNRGRARLVINVVNDIARRMDRECRCLPHRDTLIHGQFTRPVDL